jgi:hypothetical protein
MVAAYGNRAKGRRHYLRSKEETKPGAAMVGPTEKSVHRASRPLPHHRSAAVRAPLALSTLAGLGIPRRLFGASFALTSATG